MKVVMFISLLSLLSSNSAVALKLKPFTKLNVDNRAKALMTAQAAVASSVVAINPLAFLSAIGLPSALGDVFLKYHII